MQKIHAAWLALAVLAIASVIMIFFVMPQINSSKSVVADATKAVQDTARKAAGSAPQVSGTDDTAAKASRGAAAGSVLLEKVDRLKADASAAAVNLQKLYGNGKTPSDAELADARAKLEAALKAIADIKAPDGADTAVSNVVAGLSASAAKALDALKSMPQDAAKASETASQIAGLFAGKSANGTAPAPAAQASNDNKAVAPVAGPKRPQFDVLRVEKDGSTVIAGSAEPESTVEIIDDGKPIASSKAGPGGDFAIVLDKPLTPGDHTLVIKATDKSGKAVDSDEVATVSVPASKAGELLAMVSKPGEPSRILAKPEVEAGSQQQVAQAGPAAAPKAEDANAQGSVVPQSKPGTAAAPEAAEIRIDAVELEGDKIYVAGTSRPQTLIQVYADDKLIQATKSADNGHFEAEGKMALATGNHIIRADVMDAAGEKVLLRASVPFNRPAGDQVSVVADTTAPAPSTGNQSELVNGGQLEQLREEAAKAIVLLKGLFADGKTPAKDQLAAATSACEIAFKALAAFKPAPDAGQDVAAAASVAAKSAADALKLLDAAGDDPAKVGAAIASIEAAAKGAMPDVAKPASEVSKPAAPQTETSQPAAQSMASTGTKAGNEQANAGSTGGAEATQPKSIEQAPLKPSSSTVIIRKGDTLWQISRRVYGRGVRYTTIYLANEDQISDPNMITPGQVFGVPDKTLQSDEDAEKANRKFREK